MPAQQKFQVEPLSVAAKMPERVTRALQDLIRDGAYPPKSRLPSEGDMALQFGVSRTVIREAISRLKAEGMVESRQGSGVFVREAGPDTPFRIDPGLVDSIQDVLQIAELRQGVESEIAALAAIRATRKQVDEIGARLAEIDADVAAGGDGVDADIEFHRSIARATANPHFLSLWDFLSRFLKGTITVTRTWEAQREETRQQVMEEHRALYAAIVAGDVEAARAAARMHMEMSSSRIRSMTPALVATPGNKPGRRRATGSNGSKGSEG